MSTIEDDEPRVDGRDLKPPDEPGSDDLLSPETRDKIAEVIRDWADHEHRRLRDRIRDRFDDDPADQG